MGSEIIATTMNDGTPVFELRKARVFKISEVQSGVSQSTGNEWKMQHIHIELTPGSGTNAHCMRLRLERSLIGSTVMNHLQEGDYISAKVMFRIFGSKFLSNEIVCLDFVRSDA